MGIKAKNTESCKRSRARLKELKAKLGNDKKWPAP